MTLPLPILSAHDTRRVAVAAAVHPKTVSRAYRGEVVRSTCAARIVEAARSLGLPPPGPSREPMAGPGLAKAQAPAEVPPAVMPSEMDRRRARDVLRRFGRGPT
jgi:hypothetical protein